jgi:hypothetical protein
MLKSEKVFLLLMTALVVCAPTAFADDTQLVGVIVGRTGEILHISVPQPVSENSVFAVKLISTDEPIAEARVLSCTKERPYIALAKVVRGGIENAVPIGVKAYSAAASVSDPAPEPIVTRRASEPDKFSIQAGAFYPRTQEIRDTVADFWQAYRLNYRFLKARDFEGLLSAEYTKGSGDFLVGETAVRRTMEVVPVTLLGRFKPLRMGGTEFFLGAGGGIYRIRSEERLGAALTSSRADEFGYELVAGMESTRGWTAELRYRDIENTDISGYSLAMGYRF